MKFLQRLAGTCCGSILAVLMALCLEVVGKERFIYPVVHDDGWLLMCSVSKKEFSRIQFELLCYTLLLMELLLSFCSRIVFSYACLELLRSVLTSSKLPRTLCRLVAFALRSSPCLAPFKFFAAIYPWCFQLCASLAPLWCLALCCQDGFLAWHKKLRFGQVRG